MGHIRLGVLPKTRQWRDVIEFLGDPKINATKIANKALDSSQDILMDDSSKSSVSYCIWLLSELVLSSRTDNFINALDNIGIEISDQTNATKFIADISNYATCNLDSLIPRNAINTLAGLAFRETLTRTVGIYGKTLFGSNTEDIRLALKQFSTNKKFSELLHIYFKGFLSRTLRFIVDKEIANHLGPNHRFKNVQQISEFEEALDLFAGQTTRIVDSFSGGWYSKKVWKTGEITKDDADKFVYIALKKLRTDLGIGEVQ